MKKNLLYIIEMLVVGLLIFVLTYTNAFSDIDYIAKDNLYQLPRGIDSDIKIIGIDERTMTEYGPVQTWSRSIYGDLINTLNGGEGNGPLLIAFDIQFSGNVDEGDTAFAEAAKESGNVIIVDQLIYEKQLTEYGYHDVVVGVDEPYAELAEVTSIGFSNVSVDSDGTVRRIKPQEMNDGETHLMFSKIIYQEYCKLTGTTENDVPTDRYGMSLINFSGRPGDYEYIPMIDVLQGKIDSRAFEDSIVLIGAHAPGMQDKFSVPNGGSEQMYGVEIHANLLQSYMEGRFAIEGNPFLLGIITAVIAMALHFCFRKLKVWQSLILLVVSVAAYVTIMVVINNNGHCEHMIYLPIMLTLSFFYALGFHYLIESAKKRKVLNAFRKYVAPQIVEEISKKGDFEIKLGGENRDIAVLFVDIRGFTTMSEALEPETVVEILNEYLSLTTKAIFDNSGTLDKFVGDATMAVFNSPFDLPDYEFKAVCAAWDIVKGGEALEPKLLEKFGRSVGFGVGVHCGPAVVGNVGCDFRMDFTAIGDTVNTSARLEANAKKGQVLISDVLYERLKDRIEVNEIGNIPLKGKSNEITVYEVTAIKKSQD